MSKHILAILLTVISTTFCFNIAISKAQTLEEITKIKDPIKQLELALQLPPAAIKDSISFQRTLTPLFEYAEKDNNISLKWAYYMKMADGFSIAFDNTNPRSDNYYELAHELARRHNNTELEMIGYLRRGYYNFIYRKVVDAFPYFLKANDLKSSINIEKTPLLIQHYQFAADFFSYINDNELAINYIKECLPFANDKSRLKISLINSLGLYYEKLNNKKLAYEYFVHAKKEAQLAQDSVWVGIIGGNLSKYAWEKGNTVEALNLLKQNIQLSTQYHEHQDAMRANIGIAEKYILLEDWDNAYKHIQLANDGMQDKPYFLQYQVEAAYALSKIAHAKNNKLAELKHLTDYIQLKDSLDARNNFQDLQNIIWKNEREKYNLNTKYNEEKRKETIRKFIYIAVFTILVFLVITLLAHKSKARIKIKNALLERDQLKLIYEKQLVDQEVLLLKNSLVEFTNTIKQSDTIIAQLREDIANQNPSNDNVTIENNLNKLLESHLMTDERWLHFKIIFDKVYPRYLSQMKDKYDKLSENDLKILALQKLGLNNMSMSEMLCVTVDGIKKAKQRLKKKLETVQTNEYP